MGTNEVDVLNQVAQRTNSELNLFLIIVVVLLVVVILPLYAMVIRDRKERRAAEAQRVKDESEASNARQDKYIEREREIIKVITANTEIMAGLKVTLETTGATTNSSLGRIHERIDMLQNGINKLLLLVDSLPHNSNFGHGGFEK